uniref:Uncharacterized protein n=1 Tax=viral metagenome TaxID=1070528 RepID=A0A6C0BEV5_9ZZZZ
MDIFGRCTTAECDQPAAPESWGESKCDTCWGFITSKKRADEAAAKKRADEEAADIRAKQAATAAAVVEFNRIHAPSWDPNAPENWRLKKAHKRQNEKNLADIQKEKYYLEVRIRRETSLIDKKLLSSEQKTGAEKMLAKYYKELKLILAREEEALAKVTLAKEALANATLAKVALAREAGLAKAASKKKTADATDSEEDDIIVLSECFFLVEQYD